MDDPYDWELGYENLGKVRPPARAKSSHTTALKEKGGVGGGLGENKEMVTQPPVTSGEPDDGVICENGVDGVENDLVDNNQKRKEKYDDPQGTGSSKPKFKRPEFMRPKLGAVNLDVIDAVNARLAAASEDEDGENGRPLSAEAKKELFRNLRVETSVDNVENNDVNVEFNMIIPKWKQDLLKAGGSFDFDDSNRKAESSERTPKSLRSYSATKKKRHPGSGASRGGGGGLTDLTVTQFAVADDEGISTHQKHGTNITMVSKWHGSFDESLGEEEDEPDLVLPLDRSSRRTNRHDPAKGGPSGDETTPTPEKSPGKGRLSNGLSYLRKTQSVDRPHCLASSTDVPGPLSGLRSPPGVLSVGKVPAIRVSSTVKVPGFAKITSDETKSEIYIKYT